MTARLPTRYVEKPWGRTVLPQPFVASPGTAIGEIWFEPPAALPDLLIKYIFTSEALSVQVHPSNTQTLAAGLGRQGKEECWLIVSADAGARLGIGFDRALSAEALRAAALDGSIEQLLTWHPVRPGDFFYIPANTVHAIGAGIGLIEIQQNSDITYRLYDYGRPRPLHLAEAVAVARRGPYGERNRQILPPEGEVVLVNGPLFRLVRYDGALPGAKSGLSPSAPVLLVPQSGPIRVAGEQILPGDCALAVAMDGIEIGHGARGLIVQSCQPAKS